MSDEKRSPSRAPNLPALPDLDVSSLRSLRLPKAVPQVLSGSKTSGTMPRMAQPPHVVLKRKASARPLGFGVVELEGDDFADLPALEMAEDVRDAPRKNINLPTGTTPDLMQIEVDPAIARELSGYGEHPTLALFAPIYAWRVFWRKRRLLKNLKQAECDASVAEQERDAILADLVVKRRAVLESNERFQRAFEPVYALEQVTSERDQAVAKDRRELEVKLRELEHDAEKLSDARKPLEERVAAAQVQVADHELSCRRAEAKLKRVQMQMRSLSERQGPSGEGAVSADLRELSERQRLMVPELEGMRAEVENARAAAASADAQIKQLDREVERLERARADFSRAFERRLNAGQEQASLARKEYQKALADVGRALLSAHIFNIPAEILDAIRAADQGVTERLRASQTYLLAIDLYDRASVKQGVTVIVAVCLTLLLLLGFWRS